MSVLLGVLASLCSGFGGDVLAVCGFGGDACGGDVTVGRVLLERLCGGGLGMGWIATAIGAGLSVLSSLYGGAKARQQAKEADREMAASRAKNDNWFRRRYNENYADTSAGQNPAPQGPGVPAETTGARPAVSSACRVPRMPRPLWRSSRA